MGSFCMKVTEEGADFRLKNANGQVIGISDHYKTETSCMNGIASVRRCCGGGIEDHTEEEIVKIKHPKFEIYETAGKYHFLLRARNGEEIMQGGQTFPDKEACIAGIEDVKASVPGSELIRE